MVDRENPEYGPVGIMLDGRDGYEDIRDRFDELLEEAGTLEDFEKNVEASPISHSQKAKLRIALWFWNGGVPIRQGDVLCFDPANRARFIEAMKAFLWPSRSDEGEEVED